MTILKMNFLASILILVIIIIRMSMLQCLPKKTFHVLWSIALYRLLVPFFVSSRFSVCTLINMLISRTVSADVCFGFGLPIGRNVVSNIESGIPSAAVVKNTAGMDILFIQVLWLTGIFVCALFFLITHLRCLMEYKMSLPIDNVYIQKWEREHAIRREVDIRQSDRIATPLTYGLFSPVVLLPKTMNWADETQLQYILAHEYAHIRRFDILFKWLLAIAVCVHWFNLLVWIMYTLANRDIELSCDEAVVLTLGETIRVNVNIKDILKDGQTAVIGYVLDHSYQDIFSGKITQNKLIEFTAPRKGSYAFYFIGASSDTIHIQSVSVL